MSINKSVGIKTLGCRVNLYESCVIAERLIENGINVTTSDKCDYYIVNTCAVTAESERKSRQLVRRCAKKGKVIVIGCASQLNPTPYDIDNVIYIGGNTDKSHAVDVIIDSACEYEKNSVKDMYGVPYEDMCLTKKNDIFSECRAFIKIQDGCNGKCTYCIIPKCRGSVRSRNMQDIINEATALINNGYKELILTGIEVGAYNKAPLSELITEISRIDGIKRLRLGSLSPNVINDKFLNALKESQCFMPHIHLSLQSCCDKTLRAMKRPYVKQTIFDKVADIRRYIPNCMLSADIIAGFPGETDSDFAETVEALRELKLFHVHSFPYSERQGTPAADMQGSVPKHIRASRNTALINECAKIRKDIFDSMLGKTLNVLVEKITDGFAVGHSEQFFEVKIPNDSLKVGDIVKTTLTTHDGETLTGLAEEI